MMEHKCIVCCIRHTCIKVDEVFLLFWKRMYTDFGQLKRMSKVDIYLYIFCYLESYLLSCLISSLLYIEIFCHRSPKKIPFPQLLLLKKSNYGYPCILICLVSWFKSSLYTREPKRILVVYWFKSSLISLVREPQT